MKVDMWYGNSKKDVCFVDCFFYPNDCIYRGNVYDKSRKPIGDYAASNSADIEKRFPGIFGKKVC